MGDVPSPLAADLSADAAALDKRGRRVLACATWIGVVGLLLMMAAVDVAPINHFTHTGFGDMLHVPASVAPALKAQGLTVKDAVGWPLATDADHSGSIARFGFWIVGAVAVVAGVLRRQWALLPLAVALWFMPGDWFDRPLALHEALMVSSVQALDHPPTANAVEDPGQVTLNLPGPTPRNEVAASWRGLSVATPWPVVKPVQLQLGSVPPEDRADMAYVLAQAAFKDDKPQRVSAYLTAMGRAYPQDDRITRDRVRDMEDYLSSRRLPPVGPMPASSWSFVIKQTLADDIAFLMRVTLVAAVVTEIVGAGIRQRAKRIGQQLQRLPSVGVAMA